jgi:hypothetical protein
LVSGRGNLEAQSELVATLETREGKAQRRLLFDEDGSDPIPRHLGDGLGLHDPRVRGLAIQ